MVKLQLRHSTYGYSSEFIKFLFEWKGTILVISGPSGVGKTTIADYISEHYGYPSTMSVTTRERRKVYETYTFTNKKEYIERWHNQEFASYYIQHKKNKNNNFIKTKTFNKDNYKNAYGLDFKSFKELAEHSKVIVMVMSPISFHLLKELYPFVFGVYITADKEVVMKRLVERDGFIEKVRKQSYDANNRSKNAYHMCINNKKSIKGYAAMIIHQLYFYRLIKRNYTLRKMWFSSENRTYLKNTK